jgi:hypothetical protein
MTSTTRSAARVIEPRPDDVDGCVSTCGWEATDLVRCAVARGADCAAAGQGAPGLGVASVLREPEPTVLEPARR